MAGNFPHICGDQRITAIGSYWRLTYSMRSRNDSRSYHVFDIDETYIEGCPCLDDLIRVWTTPLGFGRPLSLWTRLSQDPYLKWGTSWYSIFYELLFQDELTLYGRLLKDELDLPYPSNLISLSFMFIIWESIIKYG